MQSHNNIAHQNLRSLLIERNYPNVPSGLCFGVLFAAVRFFLKDHNFDKFKRLTDLIRREGNSINSLITKVLADRVNELNEPSLHRFSLFSKQTRNIVYDLLSLLDMVAIFSLSCEYSELFNARIGHENPDLIYSHTFPCDPSSSEKLVSLGEWTGVYSALELKLLFYAINEAVNEVDKLKLVAPFVMTFSGIYNNELHVIGICFEPDLKKWYLVDANQLPVIECNNSISVNNISTFINFFSTAFSGASHFLLRTKIYSSERDADNIQEVIFKLHHSPQFKQIHMINTVKSLHHDLLGNTWLHFACANENAEFITKLIRCGSDVNKPNKDGFTPLMIAVIRQNKDAVASLLSCKADVNYVHENSATPLFLAAQIGCYDIAKMLLDAGADKNISYSTTTMAGLYSYAKGTASEDAVKSFVILKYHEKRMSGDYEAAISISPFEIAVIMQHENISKLLTGMDAGLQMPSQFLRL